MTHTAVKWGWSLVIGAIGGSGSVAHANMINGTYTA
jgi:hypothetical protein